MNMMGEIGIAPILELSPSPRVDYKIISASP